MIKAIKRFTVSDAVDVARLHFPSSSLRGRKSNDSEKHEIDCCATKPESFERCMYFDESDNPVEVLRTLMTVPDNSLVIVNNLDYADALPLVESEGIELKDECFMLVVDFPRHVFNMILKKYFVPSYTKSYIHPLASVVDSELGLNVHVERCVTISHSVVGDCSRFYDGCKIGTDDFAYYEHCGDVVRFEQLGGVSIGKNCEFYPNSCVGRGTLKDTVIGDNVKVDHLCQIGHNCIVEDSVCLCVGSVLLGCSIVRKGSYVGAGAIILNGIEVGENCVIGAGSVVTKNVPSNTVVCGVPARKIVAKEISEKTEHGKTLNG